MSAHEPRPSDSSHAHRRAAPECVPSAVITVSDTRSLETDSGGAMVVEQLEAAGHTLVAREIVADEAEAIREALERVLSNESVRAIVVTGGTGIAPRDVTPESVEPLLDRLVPGFGEIFRALSFEEIGSAALLSRALAGLARGRVVFVIPGSRGAIRLAMRELILPEIGHLAGEAVKTR